MKHWYGLSRFLEEFEGSANAMLGMWSGAYYESLFAFPSYLTLPLLLSSFCLSVKWVLLFRSVAFVLPILILPTGPCVYDRSRAGFTSGWNASKSWVNKQTAHPRKKTKNKCGIRSLKFNTQPPQRVVKYSFTTILLCVTRRKKSERVELPLSRLPHPSLVHATQSDTTI